MKFVSQMDYLETFWEFLFRNIIRVFLGATELTIYYMIVCLIKSRMYSLVLKQLKLIIIQ